MEEIRYKKDIIVSPKILFAAGAQRLEIRNCPLTPRFFNRTLDSGCVLLYTDCYMREDPLSLPV